MAVYNLAGAGVQGLTPGVDQLLVDVITFPSRASAGRATPTNYYDIGLLRVGHLGSYYPAQPIDAASMQIDVPLGVNQLGYSLFDTTNIRVTEVLAPATIGNPSRISRTANIIPVGAGAQTLWTYTVPANRVARVTILVSAVIGSQTGVTAVQVVFGGILIQIVYSSASTPANQFATQTLPTQPVLVAGEVLTAQGFNGGSTNVSCACTLLVTEFDAASWTPN